MIFKMDSNWNWIDEDTWTRFSIYHFDINWINEFTWTKRDEEWYDVNWEDKDWYDRSHKKRKENPIKKDDFNSFHHRPIDKYLNKIFNLDFFNDDLDKNKWLIKSYIKKKEDDYKRYQDKLDELSNSESLEEYYENQSELYILNYNWWYTIPPKLNECLGDPYFFFCTDDNLTYISNKDIKIHDWEKVIMPFTSPRASKLRYEDSWKNKYLLTINNWKIIRLEKKDVTETSVNNIQDNNLKTLDEIIKERKEITGNTKKSWVWDISKLLQEEQDKIMSAPAKWVTLISWVAWSWKTNILLHRIQYLVWEQPWKKNEDEIVFHQNNMIFLCFNKALQKYIESSIINKFPSIQVKTIDQWWLDIFKTYFSTNNIKLDEDTDFSIDEAKNLVNKYLSNLNDSNIWNFFVEKSWSSYKFKEWKSEKTQWSATIDINPEIINNLFPSFNCFTKKHLITWLYLISITNLKQESSNTFSLTIWNAKFNNLKPKWRTNENIDYSLSKTIYDHIFIDEVQDLSKAQIQIVNWFHNNSMTIAWDESQLLTVWTIWSNLSEVFGIKIDHKYDLKTSHRNSQQTALFANEFLKDIKYKNEIKSISFKWLKPLVINTDDSNGQLKYLCNKIKDLKSNEPNTSICIMFPKKTDVDDCVTFLQTHKIDCYSANSWSWDFSKSIHVTNYHQAKWLEFDYIFICWINNFDTRSIKNKNNIIYTLITRWIKRVFITIQGQLPKLFEWIDTNTYMLQ